MSREFNVFPSQMLDLMDAVKIAISGTHSVAEDDSGHYDDDEDGEKSDFSRRHVASTGY